MGNIFVSEEDHTRIVSLIDWQSTSISPLFLQARWPVFLKPPAGYRKGTELPKLPDNFEELDSDEKEIAMFEKDQATCTKAYEVATYLNNQDAYDAMNIAEPLRELFMRCGDTWNDGIIPLQACLIQIFKDWEQMGFSGECPIHFSSTEIASHEHEFSEYEKWQEIQEFARKYLDTDAEGWVSPEADWEKKRSQNRALLGLLIERLEAEKSEDEVRQMWPFPA
jgi:hypothetical protein